MGQACMETFLLFLFAIFIVMAGITNYSQPRESKVPVTLLIVAVLILGVRVFAVQILRSL